MLSARGLASVLLMLLITFVTQYKQIVCFRHLLILFAKLVVGHELRLVCEHFLANTAHSISHYALWRHENVFLIQIPAALLALARLVNLFNIAFEAQYWFY